MGMTVLVVDDHAGFRSTARFLLQLEGFDVIGEAADGVEAVAAAERLRPGLVLLDVQLPDAQGYDVARRILDEGLSSRVVLVSSRDEADYGDNIRTSGALGFIPKAELSGERIRSLLGEDSPCG